MASAPPLGSEGAHASAALGNSFPGIHREVTYQEKILDHWITDQELDQLTELRKDNVVEIFWGVLGIFLGSIIPALERAPKIGNPQSPVGLIDMAVLLICGVSFVVMLVMAFFWYQRSGKATSLAEKIRARNKFSVANDGNHK